MQAGFVDPKKPVAKVRPVDFEDAAKRACQTNLEEAKSIYPRVEPDNLPYLCMDLVYQFTLLVDGFGKFFLILFFYRLIFKRDQNCNWLFVHSLNQPLILGKKLHW